MKHISTTSGRMLLLATLLVVGVLAIGIATYITLQPKNPEPITQQIPTPVVEDRLVARATYVCTGMEPLTAEYFESQKTTIVPAGEALKPTGRVVLTLRDGSQEKLPQTLSGSGVRYANEGESTVFWNKGRGALITTGGSTSSVECIEVGPEVNGLSGVFASSTGGFSIRYPGDFTATTSKGGIRFTIPESMATGTNLSRDTHISLEYSPDVTDCSADLFLENGATSTLLENGITYSYASSSDAGAGNRYDEVVYALPGTNPCIAVHTFVHYTAIENYPEGMVRVFDATALTAVFTRIRSSLIVR
jgi:membrane-bound inhibitor of C-type lysozyme